MDSQSPTVLVATVGLSDRQREMIGEHCHLFVGVQVEHVSAWTFGLLQAQLLIIDMDSGVGKETLHMLSEFKESAGRSRPMVLRFSASEFRAAGWGGRLDAITAARRDQESEFCKKLQQVLAGLGAAPAAC